MIPTTHRKRSRVLLVEESPIDNRLLSPDFKELADAEFDLIAVESLAEVIHALKSAPIDAVLLDLFLEAGEGTDTLCRLRQAAPDVPIVVVTRLGDEDQALRALEYGAADFCTKGSVDSDALFRAIRYAIERKQGERQRRLLEQRLLQGHKLEAMGTLAGGVAHNFNNALTIIMGHSDLMLEEAGEDQRRHIDEIKKAAARSALLVHQLLTFSRREPVAAAFNTLNQILLGMQMVLESTLDNGIELQLKLAPNPPAVKVDTNQIKQIVMNLAMNARDAMPHGGMVIIETGMVGERVLLTVTDTGCGMSPETRSHIFEPFFTTKGLAHSSGLGLSTVYGIVLKHGGNVQVASEPGRGTTVSIYLPAFDWTEGQRRASLNSVPHRLATILIVEDDQSVRKFLLRVLGETRRYTLLDAADWAQALELADVHQGPIDLLIANNVISALMLHPGRGRQDMKAIDITPDLSKSSALTEESVLQCVEEALNPEAAAQRTGELLTPTH